MNCTGSLITAISIAILLFVGRPDLSDAIRCWAIEYAEIGYCDEKTLISKPGEKP